MIQIEILSVKTTTNPTKTPGKTYQALEVAYKNLSFGNKVEGRKIMSFGATASTFTTLANAQPGELYDVDAKKNEGSGYIEWLSAKKSEGGTTTPSTSTSGGKPTPTSYAAPKSTYETPEERAKKQVYIVRQSSVGAAIELLAISSKAKPTVDEVIDIAKQFEGYVFGDLKTEPIRVSASLAEMEDSVL